MTGQVTTNGHEMTASCGAGNGEAAARPHLALRHLVYLAALWVAIAAPLAAAETPEPPAIDRDAVWRSIFKRPRELPDPKPVAGEADLGRRLFNDPRLSGSGSMACATCHQEARTFTDGRPLGQGRDGAVLDRNVPMLLNLAWASSFFWDGRAKSLEEQAKGPILATTEMAGDLSTIIATLENDPEVRALFAAAYPGREPVREETLLKALAAYERTLISPKTRFDRWVEGDKAALTETEREGFAIFVGKGGCVSCHGGWRFTDDTRHDIGLAAQAGEAPNFKTPSLRETLWTAPYMHDGSKATLRAVIDHYAGDLKERPTLANNVVRNLSLTESEKESLVSFLKTLSSDAKK